MESYIPAPQFPSSDERVESDCFATARELSTVDKRKEIKSDRPKLVVGPQHFETIKLIGEGAFGKVILVRNKLNDMIYAMKAISKKLLKKKNHIQYMKSEREILTKADHPFVVRLRFAFQSEKRVFLVMDYLSGGELFFHLRKRGIIQEFECRFYMAEMVLAIEYLHLIGIIHRDLKPENVLLAADGHLMLTDFGLAKETGNQETSRTLCGTNEYMAPEMLTRNGYGKSVDWWAAGILMYEMIAGKPPFQGETQLELDRKILSEKVKLPPHVSPVAHSLLKGLLEKDVNKRLGAMKGNMFSIGGVAALKQHEFFSDLDWIALYHKEVHPVIDVTQGGSAETQNFDEEFTSQGVSQSMIEDVLSNATTPTGGRSRAGSEDRYENFEYMEPSFEFTEDRLKEVEAELSTRLVKLQKKRLHREKLEEIRLQKLAELEAVEKIRLEEERLKKELQDRERKQKEDAEKERLLIEAERRKYEKEQERRRNYWENAAIVEERYQSNFIAVQKKIKNLNKKLREINELEIKINDGLAISVEQKLKVSKKFEVEVEIKNFTEEETLLAKSKPIFDDSIPKPDLQIEVGKLDGVSSGVDKTETIIISTDTAASSSTTEPRDSSIAPTEKIASTIEPTRKAVQESTGGMASTDKDDVTSKSKKNEEDCWEVVSTVKGKKRGGKR